ncbi:MAG: hypothetical protein SFU98_05275 [Leptospiraceae bacterium]|nr:hypothetical protein [Leptospiraceae bacterium]
MKRRNNLLIFFVLTFLLNCFSPNQRYETGRPVIRDTETEKRFFLTEEEQFESGDKYWFIDWPGHYLFSLPAKLYLLNWSFGNHDIDDKTKEIVKKYFKENNIKDVKVRFNQYAPWDEFSRLRKNTKVSPWLRWTLGLINWTIKTIFPERLFAGLGVEVIGGGDYYDPYTNTVHIFSGSTPIALHEGGHAKDFSQTKDKSSYALLRLVPFAALYQEAIATEDAVGYLRKECLLKEERSAYRELIPAYGTYMGGEMSGFVREADALSVQLGALGVAHVYGHYKYFTFKESEVKSCNEKPKLSSK